MITNLRKTFKFNIFVRIKMKKIIAQGAEAILYKENNKLIKHRIKKYYRINQLDKKIRKTNTRREINLLQKVSSLIPVPKITSFSDKTMKINMEYIDGKLLRNILDKLNSKEREKVCKKIGEQVALLHKNNIIHGDLTTSNIILKQNKVYFIDFGLGFISHKVEDKAVDLHLLKQALEAKHYKHFEISFNYILQGYKKIDEKLFNEVINRLKKVEQRGRYKEKTF